MGQPSLFLRTVADIGKILYNHFICTAFQCAVSVISITCKEYKMSNFKTLLSALNKNGSALYIQTHNFPDPDAIASAFGLQKLLQSRGVASCICYSGRIDRYNTNKMIDSLGIELINTKELAPVDGTEEFILVDCQKGNPNIHSICGNEVICIDHHPVSSESPYLFEDIRPEAGSCSSIIAEYFMRNDIPIDTPAATALLYGIKIDTANLTRGVSRLDLDMFYSLYQLCDRDILSHLEQNNLQFDDLEAYTNAINSIRVIGDVSFANTGTNCPEALIATISDFMLALAEVQFSIVYSVQEEGIRLSVRSEYLKYDAGKVCSYALHGIGDGGGHPTMAAGFVPFTGITRDDRLLIPMIQIRFLEELGQTSSCLFL